MKINSYIIALVFVCQYFHCPEVRSQAIFEAPDTVCIFDTVTIINNSRTAGTYYWNFCTGNIINTPHGENIQNASGLNGPSYLDIAEDNGVYYTFVANKTDGTLTRYIFNDGLLSEPVSENLGNFESAIPLNAQGVQVINDNNTWYVFITGGQGVTSKIVRLNFGSSLSNYPTSLDLGNIGNLDSPVDLFMFKENNTWYSYTVNYNSSTVSRLNFGNSLNNRPSGLNLGNIGNLNGPAGFTIWRENDIWYLFVANSISNRISRLQFGNSLSNLPEGANIGGEEFLNLPSDIVLSNDCNIIFGYVINDHNDIVRLDFNSGITEEPEFTSLGTMEILDDPCGFSNVFRVGDTLYTFVANTGNSTLTRLLLTGCDNSSISSCGDSNPPDIFYDSPGVYKISLILDEGTIDQEYYCRNIYVFNNPEFALGNDTTIALGTDLIIDAGEGYSSYYWSTGETSQSVSVSTEGVYSVTVSNEYGCPGSDEMEVFVDAGIPGFITPNGDGYNDTWELPFLRDYEKSVIKIYDRFGNSVITYKGGERGWDGTAGGKPVNPDTYWYVIDLKDGSSPLKGSITVKYQ
jgi:gliding motility-associated-like protein